LFVIVWKRKKKGTKLLAAFDMRRAALAATAGVLTYGVAAVAFIVAIQILGAGRAVLVTSTSPILLLPFSVFILKETITANALVGILLCVAGVYLVVM
jgi:drug/metabolite transporter (DMT)-like permease